MENEGRKVLSIQSSVVYGYVGNKIATFPLQLYGYDVSPINTNQFSNHTEYGRRFGHIADGEEATALFDGLRLYHLMDYSHILTGYIVSEAFCYKTVELVKELKSHNPNIIYVCDPVMGDNGHLYADEGIVSMYRDVLIKMADVITPNQFELEVLSGRRISCEAEAWLAMDQLHDQGVPTVVMTSGELGDCHSLICLASQRKGNRKHNYRLKMPKLPDNFFGTGDLFAASLLAWMDRDKDLKSALEKTVSVVHAVVERTYKYAQRCAGPNGTPSMAQKELRLIQSRHDIEFPNVIYKAETVSNIGCGDVITDYNDVIEEYDDVMYDFSDCFDTCCHNTSLQCNEGVDLDIVSLCIGAVPETQA